MVEGGRGTVLGSPPSRVSRAQEHDPESPSLGKRPGPWPPRVGLGAETSVSNAEENIPKSRVGGGGGNNWARRTGFKSSGLHSTSSEFGLATSLSAPVVDKGNVEPDKAAGAPAPPLPKPPGYGKRSSTLNIESGPSVTANANTGNDKRPSVLSPKVPDAPASVPASSPAVANQENKASLGAEKNNRVLPNNGQTKLDSTRNARDVELDVISSHDAEDMAVGHPDMRYELRETPGILSMILYAIQHYVSIIGSLVLIPLVVVPAMNGTDEDTAKVVSTVLLLSGISTFIHSWFGSRLPLVQGASFVYLAPVLTIIFSNDHSSAKNIFKEIMREWQGAMIVGSIFKLILGYSGLMSVLLRVINPVVIAPTVAAVGLSFYSYGFTVVGTCVEIGIPQIVVIVVLALHLRKISIFGHRIFQVYAVPLGLGLTWAYAFLLTEIGLYNYDGCDMKAVHPQSSCQKHIYTMQHCRTDTSEALKTMAWFRVPYPFQWGYPTFHFRSSLLIVVASIIASVDSVGTYHAASLLVASRPPTPGIVSRGIGTEGLTSLLAGIWGTGTGMSTLTENVHTIAVTKNGSRRTVELGAFLLVLLSFIGKVGAFIASIPKVIVAGLLCFIWSMLVALGLSKLRYSQTRSSRNMLIVGLSLLFALSVPSYFQQYAGKSITTLEKQYQPYGVGENGPIRTGVHAINHFLNNVLSMHMVIAFIVAFILDNTVPGSRQERGTYTWSSSSASREEPAVAKDYNLPFGLSRYFSWVKWIGL